MEAGSWSLNCQKIFIFLFWVKKCFQVKQSRTWESFSILIWISTNHSLSKHGLETALKSLFYLFVRVYAVLCTRCTVNEHIVFQYNERIIQSQRFSSVIQPCYLNINKPKTKDVHGGRYGST